MEYTRVHRSAPEYTGVLEYTGVHWSTLEYTGVHWDTLEYTVMCYCFLLFYQFLIRLEVKQLYFGRRIGGPKSIDFGVQK